MQNPTINIRIGNRIYVTFNPLIGRWYMTDDHVTWHDLPANIKSADTAIARAMAYFGVH